MSIILIDEATQALISKAVEKARADPLIITDEEKLKLQGLTNMPDGSTIKLSDRPRDWAMHERQNVLIPFGFRAAIGFEMQPEPLGMCMHLSLSAARGRIPRLEAVLMVAKAFGMVKDGYPRRTWLEEFEPGWHAVNLVEPVQWQKQ